MYRRAVEYAHKSDEKVDFEAEAAAARKELERLSKEEERHGRLIVKGMLSEEAGEKLLSEIQQRKREAQAKLDRASMSMEARVEEKKTARRREAEIRLMKRGIKNASEYNFTAWRKLVVAFVEWMTAPPAKYGKHLALTADGQLKLV